MRRFAQNAAVAFAWVCVDAALARWLGEAWSAVDLARDGAGMLVFGYLIDDLVGGSWRR